VLNFAGRKYIVFPEKKAGVWKPTGGDTLKEEQVTEKVS